MYPLQEESYWQKGRSKKWKITLNRGKRRYKIKNIFLQVFHISKGLKKRIIQLKKEKILKILKRIIIIEKLNLKCYTV